MTLHNVLANSELHEDKSISTANDQEMYWSDGSGSGSFNPLMETIGSWTHSTDISEIEFTGLDNYSILQIDCVGITLDTETDQYILLQVGDDSGYTTSSIYFNNYWGSNLEDTTVLSGYAMMYYRNSAPANSTINYSSALLTNFNIARYSMITSQEASDESTTTVNAFLSRTQWIREKKAYNKLKVLPATDNLNAGTIILSGMRYEV